MSNCDNCYQGCAETISDKCVKYTGIDIPQLGIVKGDSLAVVEQKIFNHLRVGTGIVIDLSGISICSIMQDYLPASQDYPPGSENAPTEFVLNDVLAALIQYACLLQGQIGLQGQRIADNNLSAIALVNEERFARVNEFEAVAGIITTISATFTTDIQNAVALITSESIARANANEATASVIDTISASITALDLDVDARITEERTAAVTREQAIATSVDTVEASLNTETASRQAAVTTLTQSLANETSARATLNTTLSAAIATETSNRQAAISTLQQADVTESTARAALETSLNAKITTEKNTREAAVTTLSQSIVDESSARATLGTNLNAAIATETTNRQSAVTTLQQADTTEAQTRAALGTTLTAAIATETTNRQAAITTLNTAIADETSARASAISTLGTTVTNNYNTLSSNITSEASARTTAVQSVADSVTSLTSTVNGYSASITTTQNTLADINGRLSASYGLTVDAGGRIASMKLMSSNTTSEIAFTADSFKIFNGTSNVSPFSVVGGNVIMTGTTTVDTIITPGTGPAIGQAGWNGLSLNNASDNLLQFRHPNGVIGMKMGIVGGVLTLNWYDTAGNLIWQGGTAGVKAVDNTVAAYSGQITNLGYFTLGTINLGTVNNTVSIPTTIYGDTVSAVANWYKAEYDNSDPPGLLVEASAAFTVTFSNPHSDGKYRPNIFIEIGGGNYKQITEFTKVSNNSFSFNVKNLTIANAGWVVTGAKIRFEIVKTLF